MMRPAARQPAGPRRGHPGLRACCPGRATLRLPTCAWKARVASPALRASAASSSFSGCPISWGSFISIAAAAGRAGGGGGMGKKWARSLGRNHADTPCSAAGWAVRPWPGKPCSSRLWRRELWQPKRGRLTSSSADDCTGQRLPGQASHSSSLHNPAPPPPPTHLPPSRGKTPQRQSLSRCPPEYRSGCARTLKRPPPPAGCGKAGGPGRWACRCRAGCRPSWRHAAHAWEPSKGCGLLLYAWAAVV